MDLNELKEAAKTWHQILEIRDEGDSIVVTVGHGLVNNSEGSRLLGDSISIPTTKELREFIEGPEIQAKVFNPSERGIVLVDIAGYSTFDTRGQGAMLAAFHEGLRTGEAANDLFSGGDTNIDLIVPTGDGCFIILKPNVTEYVLQSVFSIHSGFYCHQTRLRNRFEINGEVLGLRFACHVGEVSFITDSAGNRNAYGTGMNETARILDLGRQKYRDASKDEDPTGTVFFEELLDSQAEILKGFFERGIVGENPPRVMDLGTAEDKHGFKYEIRSFGPLPNHVGFSFGSPHPDLPNPNPIFLTC